MPLAPLPANNTARAWLKYTSMGTEHEMCFRLPAASTTTDYITIAASLANGLKGFMWSSDAFTSLRYSAAGSIVSFPLAFTAITGTNGTSPVVDDEAKFVAMSGRSSAGYRCRITFFTPYPADTLGFRVAAPASFAPAALYATVTGLSIPLHAVDQVAVIWNAYINIGYNSYWQRQLR